jgi:hypothetical protein
MSAAGPARADDAADVRQALHEALELQAPIPTDPPSFPIPGANRPTPPPGQAVRRVATETARGEAVREVAHAVRDAHVAAANRAAAHAAQEASKAARSDASSAPGQARSQEKRGIGNGKGNGKANGNGNNGNGNNGNGNGNGNNGNGNGTKK